MSVSKILEILALVALDSSPWNIKLDLNDSKMYRINQGHPAWFHIAVPAWRDNWKDYHQEIVYRTGELQTQPSPPPAPAWFLFHINGFLSRQKGRTLPGLVDLWDKKGMPTEVRDVPAIRGRVKVLRWWQCSPSPNQGDRIVQSQGQHTHRLAGTRQMT